MGRLGVILLTDHVGQCGQGGHGRLALGEEGVVDRGDAAVDDRALRGRKARGPPDQQLAHRQHELGL